MAVEKLDSWRRAGEDFAGALENAAVGGWQGLFLPDAGQKPKPQTTGRHAGFASKNYREGIAEDGTLV